MRLAPLVLLCGACAVDREPGVTTLPIIEGTAAPDDHAVVALVDPGGNPFCSGTVVSPHVVLTAGHCVVFGAPRWAFIGDDVAQGGRYVDVRDAIAYPDFDGSQLDNDLGVVILDDAIGAGDATPVPILTRAPTVGEVARFVGYGYTQVGPAGDYGRRYQAEASITSVEPTLFGYGVVTCNGDSGGPAFLMDEGVEVVAGVTSFGDVSCEMFGYDTRIDQYSDWILSQIDMFDPPGSADSDGCGCRVAPNERGGGAPWLLGLLSALVIRRRSRKDATPRPIC